MDVSVYFMHYVQSAEIYRSYEAVLPCFYRSLAAFAVPVLKIASLLETALVYGF